MGKASSAKKVARAARAGGRPSGTRQRNLLFPGAIVLIVLLGGALVGYAASERKSDDQVAPVAYQDHWHASYGIYICDQFLPAIPEVESTDGIHTHGDGVIHIHPYTQNASGDNATLGVFLEAVGVELSDGQLTVNGETYTDGEDTCGEGDEEEPGELVVAQWKDIQTSDSNPALFESEFDDVRFAEDGEGYVIAFVPEGADIPKPNSAGNLAELGAADDADATTTTAGGGEGQPAEGEGDGGGEPSGDDSGEGGGEPDGETTTTSGDTTTTTGG